MRGQGASCRRDRPLSKQTGCYKEEFINRSQMRKALKMSEQGIAEQQCINTIRFLAADAIEKARKSGHPGMPMGAAAAAFTLWTRHLKHNPADPLWPDRDRFVLSAGHASMLLYALLYLSGYDLSLDDLKAFRQWGSKTPGHPERRHPAGTEMTTGPLGQGAGRGGRNGDRGGPPRGPVQPARTYGRGSPNLRFCQRRRSDGGALRGGLCARRTPRPGEADPSVR